MLAYWPYRFIGKVTLAFERLRSSSSRPARLLVRQRQHQSLLLHLCRPGLRPCHKDQPGSGWRLSCWRAGSAAIASERCVRRSIMLVAVLLRRSSKPRSAIAWFTADMLLFVLPAHCAALDARQAAAHSRRRRSSIIAASISGCALLASRIGSHCQACPDRSAIVEVGIILRQSLDQCP